MKVVIIGTDRKIFEQGSAVQKRQIEYGKMFEELHIVVFATRSLELRFKSLKIGENVFVYPTNSRGKISYIFDAFKIVKGITTRIKNKNLIISTQDPFETGIVGVLSKIFYGMPLHLQLHTDFSNKYFILHSPLNFIRFLLAHITLPFADAVRCVSEKSAKGIREFNKNISVLPISQVINTSQTDKGKEFKGRILTVCRLEKEKDLGTAIKSFKKLSEFYPEATFTIVGDGKERQSLEMVTKSLGVEDKIKFVGWQDDLSGFYKNSDIYISTSLFEGYGLSVMEAALYGLPLILSDAGIAEEYFKNKGALVCEPKDESAFYKSLLVLFKDREARITMSQEVRRSAEEKIMSWHKYLELYKKDLDIMSGRLGGNILLRSLIFLLSVINGNKVIRFVIAGGTVAVTQIGLLYLITEVFGLWYLFSSTLSFIYAVISSFLLQKYWAFRDKSSDRAIGQFLKFIIVAVIGIVINTLSMYFWVDMVGIWYVASQFITGFIIALINFLIYKFFIFNK